MTETFDPPSPSPMAPSPGVMLGGCNGGVSAEALLKVIEKLLACCGVSPWL